MLKKTLATLFAFLIVSFVFIIAKPYAYAYDPPMKIYVDPPAIINEAYVPGTLFNVSIKIANIPVDPGAVGIELNLTWDSNILKGVSMQEMIFHEVTPESEWSNIWKLKHVVAPNSILYAYTFQDIDAAITGGYAPISGNHTIAEITLNVTGVGQTLLHFFVSKVGDRDANVMLHDTFDGFFSNAPPPAPALFYVDPSKISNVSLVPGSDFAVNVDIANASGVYGLEFTLGFNASMLSANSVTKGGFIPPSVTPITEIDNVAGFVRFNVSSSTSLDGNGVLAEISFHVLGLGKTTLHLYGIQLIDSLGEPLPFSSSDGSFDNVLLAKLAVDPPSIIDPTLLPPATFTINITLADVRDLYGYQFNLTFDTNILICLQLQIYDVLGETHYVPNMSIDNTRGFVFVNVAYYPPAVPLDIDAPTPLVTIKFRVKAIGGTNLTLTDTQLTDSGGQPITHEVHHGYFQSLIVDIAVVDLFASPSTLYKGLSTNVTVTVMNQGNSTETFAVNIYYNSTLLTTVNIVGLAPGTNASATVLWNTGTVTWGKYVLSAHVPPLPYETDLADNTLIDGIVKVKIPGDINGDDVVDIYDALLASNAFGSTPGSPNWNPAADLNGDGVVDIYDVIILANNFGQKI